MKTTVCQMVRHINKNGESGLIFSDEVEVETSQSFSYMAPFLPEIFRGFFASYTKLGPQSLELEFPCSVNGDMVVLTSKLSFPDISFETDFGSKVTFSFDSDGFWPFQPWNYRKLKEHRYLGRYPLASSDDLIFVELQPIDIHEMNELYTEHSFAFVGLTGTFGPSIEPRVVFSLGPANPLLFEQRRAAQDD